MNYQTLYTEIVLPQYAGMTDAEIVAALNAAGAGRQRVLIASLQAAALESGVYTALRTAVADSRTPAEVKALCQTVLDLANARFDTVDLDNPASVQMFGALQQVGVITAQQAAAIDALADVVIASWARANLGVDVTAQDIATARLWVDHQTLAGRLAAGYNSAVAALDAGLRAGALPLWADLVAVIEAAYL